MNFKEEYIRCLRDKTRKYFIEHYLSTFNADERKEVPFRLFPRQVEFLRSLCEHPNTIAIKHRQAGITTVSSAWITGQCVFASSKSPETILCIGNKLDISQQLVEKIGIFLDQVPRWMWGSEYYSPDPKSEKNTKSIYKQGINNISNYLTVVEYTQGHLVRMLPVVFLPFQYLFLTRLRLFKMVLRYMPKRLLRPHR